MMRSTFSGFTIAQLAMAASQRALDVTGQNIANINTAGYTRQQVDLVSLNLRNGDSIATSPSSKIGYGVEITGISQIRDPFLDVQYRNQIAKVGTADARQSTLDQLADIFDETDKSALNQALTDLSSSLEQLSSDSSNSEFDSIVRSRCQVLLNYIHQKADDLKTVREDAVYTLENSEIPTVNGLLSDIAELNDSIWKSQILGNPALELKDQRNSKLDELASYLPISVTYNDVKIATGATYEYPVVKFRASNGISYNLTAGEHGQNYAALSTKQNTNAKGETDGSVSIFLAPANDFASATESDDLKTDITYDIKDGTLKGIVDMLNKSGELDSPTSDYRGIGYYEKSFDSFVQTFAKTFNELNQNTLPVKTVRGIPDTGTVSGTPDGTANEFLTYSFDFSKTKGNFLANETITINGHSYKFGDGNNGTIAIGDTLEKSMENLAAALNISVTDAGNNQPTNLKLEGESPDFASGLWSYDSSSKSLIWKANVPKPTGYSSTVKDKVKAMDGSELSISYAGDPSNIKDFSLFKTSDGSSVFTAENIKISDDWMNNSIYILASHDKDAGSTENENILKMIVALTETRDFNYEYSYTDENGDPQNGSINFYKGSFSQCYSNLENTQGIDSAANSAILNNHVTVLKQTANNRDAVSGVSLDEEGINLMQYQRSYTAAARLMTTLDEALNVLINNTGVVGR